MTKLVDNRTAASELLSRSAELADYVVDGLWPMYQDGQWRLGNMATWPPGGGPGPLCAALFKYQTDVLGFQNRELLGAAIATVDRALDENLTVVGHRPEGGLWGLGDDLSTSDIAAMEFMVNMGMTYHILGRSLPYRTRRRWLQAFLDWAVHMQTVGNQTYYINGNVEAGMACACWFAYITAREHTHPLTSHLLKLYDQKWANMIDPEHPVDINGAALATNPTWDGVGRINTVTGAQWNHRDYQTYLTDANDAGALTRYAFTGAAATDIITATGSAYSNGQRVQLFGITGLAGLKAEQRYYVVNVSGATFQLSLTSGGAAIDITADGSGEVSKGSWDPNYHVLAMSRIATLYFFNPHDSQVLQLAEGMLTKATASLNISDVLRVDQTTWIQDGTKGARQDAPIRFQSPMPSILGMFATRTFFSDGGASSKMVDCFMDAVDDQYREQIDDITISPGLIRETATDIALPLVAAQFAVAQAEIAA